MDAPPLANERERTKACLAAHPENTKLLSDKLVKPLWARKRIYSVYYRVIEI